MRPRYMLRALRVAFVAAFPLIALTLAGTAFGAETSSTNLFPNPTGLYYSTNTGFYPTPSGLVTLEGLTLTSPTGSIPPPAAFAVWGGTFNATTKMSFFGGPTTITSVPGDSASASITALPGSPPTHPYATEMLSMDLVGLPSGARIRESPTLASTGSHVITDTPPTFHIDSFFDVFTELSLDGGGTWTPATSSVHIQNPEPTGLALLAFATPLLFRRWRRRD